MFVAFPNQAESWTPVFAILSAATMTLGNLVALQQRQVVRLLAYSSIAHAGYMLLPFAVVGRGADASAFSASVTYILIYGVMNLGIFAVVVGLSREAPRLLISDFAGLVRRAPVIAIAVAVFMVSLAGIPPTAGFWAKFFVFRAAIEGGGFGPWLAALMVVNSVISLYYYLTVARQAVIVEGEETVFRAPALVTGVVFVATVVILVVGVYPDLFAEFPQVSTLAGG
jgi:NADH-quinone oxidoreductase subunit N